MHPVLILAVIPLLIRTAAFAQCQGGREVNPNFVTITRPSIFNMIGSSPNCLTVLSGLPAMVCSGRDIVIVNHNTGPTAPDLNSTTDVRMFLTWQRQNRTDILIAFITNTVMTFTSVELYFLSYPTQRIGLPNIQLFGSANQLFPGDLSGGTPINYTFSDVFTPQENTVNNVTLPFLSNPGPFNGVRLQMSFTGVDNIDWFFLSEIRVCTGTTPPSLPAIQFQSPSDGERIVMDTSSGIPTSVVLNCTVSVAGVFEWRWRKDNQILQNGGRFQITTALGTRTNKLAISQLRSTDVGNYTCEVRHQSQSGYGLRKVELVLPVAVVVQQTGCTDDGGVMLTCEVYGYLRSVNNPTWWREIEGSRHHLNNTSKYTIQNGRGYQLAQNVDGTPCLSQVANLTVYQLERADSGTYICQVEGEEGAAVLTLIPSNRPTGGTADTTTLIPSNRPTGGTADTTVITSESTAGISPSHTTPGNQLCSCTTESVCTCTTTTAVASVITAIIVVCVSVVVHIAVCVYYTKTKKTNPMTHSAGDVNTAITEAVYEEVSEGNKVLEMKQNRAYSPHPLKQ